MKRFIILFIFAWLITTNQTETIRDNQDGTFSVTHKRYCTEVAPSYKGNDVIVRANGREIVLRIDQYTVEVVDRCP